MIAIIDYNAGNLTSVRLAFNAIGCPAIVTSVPEIIYAADRVVFPGVGAAGSAMQTLETRHLLPVIKTVIARGIPFLGICLGTQILLDNSEEDNGTPTLGILSGNVARFQPTRQWDKVPQIGWNQVIFTQSHPLLNGIADGSEFYFVHSFYPVPSNPAHVIGTTNYANITFASIIGHANVVATQFHPEKSGRIGLRLLENFIQWTPASPS